jgi:hypothetical protein
LVSFWNLALPSSAAAVALLAAMVEAAVLLASQKPRVNPGDIVDFSD